MRAACGGTWLVRPAQIELPPDRPPDLPLPDLHAPVLGISTDSRSIKAGQAFVALRGGNFDGHRFVVDAAAAGAPFVIIDDAGCLPAEGIKAGVGVMKVADTSGALLKLAGAYRKSLARTKVIAVCGSNGKTTTTRLITHLLSQSFRGTASLKSFNNAVGVPLTILSAKENDQFLVCEVGTNAPGEIATLGEVVQPDIAVITSIGREHLEGLADLAGVAKEEAAILKFLRAKGCAIVTADSPELAEHVSKSGITAQGGVVVTFGRDQGANIRLTKAAHEVLPGGGGVIGLRFTINARQEVLLPLVGEHNALNAIAAMLVARRMGMDDAKAASALASAAGADMRLSVIDVGPVRVINDAYNANPDSMLAAIQTVALLRQSVMRERTRLVLVLGQMLELGGAAEALHRQIGETIAAMPEGTVDRVALVGPRFRAGGEALSRGGYSAQRLLHVSETDAPGVEAVASIIQPGDLVLLKGSRAVRLERVLDAIKTRFAGASGHIALADGVSGGGRGTTPETFPAADISPKSKVVSQPIGAATAGGARHISTLAPETFSGATKK